MLIYPDPGFVIYVPAAGTNNGQWDTRWESNSPFRLGEMLADYFARVELLIRADLSPISGSYLTLADVKFIIVNIETRRVEKPFYRAEARPWNRRFHLTLAERIRLQRLLPKEDERFREIEEAIAGVGRSLLPPPFVFDRKL